MEKPEVTEVNLQPVTQAVPMKVGNFYKAANGAVWCCFQYYDDLYHCIRAPDNIIARFEADGRLQRDDGSSEDTLVERCIHPVHNTSIDVVERLSLILQQMDDLLPLVEGQAIVVQKMTNRVHHLRHVLTKLADGEVVGDAVVATARKALLWLATREATPMKDR